MQKKHLMAFTLATIVLLLGYNLVNGYRQEQNRAAIAETNAAIENNDSGNSNDNNDAANSTIDVTAQPLGEQPKAILDNATTQIEQAQNLEQQRLNEMDAAQ